MAKEEKKEETETPKESQEESKKNKDVSEDEQSEQSEEDLKEEKDQHIDWKKVAEDEQLRREKAEKVLAEKRFKQKKKEEDEDEDEEEEERPLTSKELEKILAKERGAVRREVLAGRIAEVARSYADSDEEADAIVAIYNNRSFPETLTLEQQVREAYFIAHGPRLLAKRDELRRALKGKMGTSQAGAEDSYRDAPQKGEPQIAPQDRAEMQRLGFTWDGKQFSKKLKSGKSLIKDWKTKKVFVK